MSAVPSAAISTSMSMIETLIKMSGIRQRSLRGWKLPFTGHHLIYPDPVEQAIAYTFAPFLLCCALHHIIQSTAKRIRRRKSRKSIKGYDVLNTDDAIQGRAGWQRRRWTRWYRAPMTGLRNTMELRTLPASWVSVSNYAELCWTVVYCAIVLVPTFYLSYGEGYGKPGSRHRWANPTGAAAFAQLPIIIALAGKNNLISFLTGVSYQELNYLHRASGRLCLLCSWIHTIGWIDGAYDIGMTGRFGYSQDWIIWGFVGLAALTILTLSSFRIMRQMAYEAFLFIHIVTTILFLVGCYFHWDWQAYWIWSGFFFWIVDRIISFARLVVVNKLWLIKSESKDECGQGTIELLDGEVMRLTTKRDTLDWKAGQHVFLSMPSIGWTKVEQHPFSMANSPVEGYSNDAVFLIKAEQGFTRQLYNMVQTSKTINIPTYLDGPYGASIDVSYYPTVIGIAGGTGITHILSHAIHLLALTCSQQSSLRHLHIIWNIRHTSHVEWIAPLLNAHFANLPTAKQLRLTIDIHVTRESVSNDAGEEQIHLSEAFEGVLEALPNHMRRERRRSMAMQMQIDDDDGDDDNIVPLDRMQERRPILRSSDSFLTEEQEVRYTKRGDRHDLSDEVWRLIRWTSGRAQLKGYVRQDVDNSLGDVGLLVCGPKELLDDAANVVREIDTARAVWDGQPAIVFYRDTFGW